MLDISNKQQLGLRQKGDDDDTEEMLRYLYRVKKFFNNCITLTV